MRTNEYLSASLRLSHSVLQLLDRGGLYPGPQQAGFKFIDELEKGYIMGKMDEDISLRRQVMILAFHWEKCKLPSCPCDRVRFRFP